MKILLITDLYPVTDCENLTPRTLYDFVSGWLEAGHNVKVIKPNFILNSFVRKKPYYKTGWYNNVYNVNYWLPFCGDVKAKLKPFYEKEFEPDIVLAHMPSGIIFAQKLGLPFVPVIHFSDIAVLTKKLYFLYFKQKLLAALKNSKAIGCRSFVLRKKLLNLYPEFGGKVFVVPSGVDEAYIKNEADAQVDMNNLKIMTCANFKKRKNIDKVILGQKGIEGVTLTVAGDGKEKSYLQNLDKSVRFTGRLSHDEVLKSMRENDIFILPSVNETFGMVYLEAMSSGCIPVCTKDDGIDGIIKSGENGFTIKPTVEGVKNIITHLKNMKSEDLIKIKQNALNTAKDYSKRICCENYIDNVMKFMNEI